MFGWSHYMIHYNATTFEPQVIFHSLIFLCFCVCLSLLISSCRMWNRLSPQVWKVHSQPVWYQPENNGWITWFNETVYIILKVGGLHHFLEGEYDQQIVEKILYLSLVFSKISLRIRFWACIHSASQRLAEGHYTNYLLCS